MEGDEDIIYLLLFLFLITFLIECKRVKGVIRDELVIELKLKFEFF